MIKNCAIIIHVACSENEILAQLAEHTPFKRRVEGSNPSYLTKRSVSCFVIRIFCYPDKMKFCQKRKAAQEMDLQNQLRLHNRTERIVKSGIQEGKIAGACVAVCRDQEEYLCEAYGMADLERKLPMQENAIFRMFSLTKPVTAVMTMQLWEAGFLELSEPVSWYIPSFREKMVDKDGELVPAEREILIQDLLNMTSGIPYPDQYSLSQKKMGELYGEIDRRNDTDHPIDTQELARRIGEEVPLLFQPGAKWAYGASADVLGAVLEKAADMPLDELYRENIFKPLGMTDTDFYVPEEKRGRLAQLYNYCWKDGKGELVIEPDPHLGMTDYRKKPAFFSGGAGLVSTVRDYMQFANMLAGKGFHRESGMRLIGENTWRYLTTPQLNAAQKEGIDWPQLKGYTYGNLLRVLEEPQACMTNVPAGEFGWDGWTGPYFCVSPQDGTVLLYLVQTCGGSTSDIVRKLRTATFGC